MKKLSFLVILLFSIFILNAQMSIDTKSEKFKIPRIYVGVLNYTNFSPENMKTSSYTSLRIGGELNYNINKKLSVNSFMANEITKENNIAIACYYVKYNFSNKINLQFGQVATPATLIRPHPVSSDGQFESWSSSQLPNAGLGIMLSINKIKLGVYKRDNSYEFHGYLKNRNFSMSSWYSTENIVGTVIDYKKKRIQTTFTVKSKFVDSNYDYIQINYFFAHSVNKKNNLFIYLDGGNEIREEIFPVLVPVFVPGWEEPRMMLDEEVRNVLRINHLQIGILKFLKTKYVKLTMGCALDYTSREFVGILQINI